MSEPPRSPSRISRRAALWAMAAVGGTVALSAAVPLVARSVIARITGGVG
jgi:hypothetical protein